MSTNNQGVDSEFFKSEVSVGCCFEGFILYLNGWLCCNCPKTQKVVVAVVAKLSWSRANQTLGLIPRGEEVSYIMISAPRTVLI